MSLESLMDGASTSGMAVAGELASAELAELQKSLTAGYGSDMSSLTGGSAFRIQSLDTTLKAVVQDNKHFALFNALPKPRATAVLDEWTEQTSVGGFLGGTFNDQDGDAMEANGDYTRRTGQVKYMMTYRKVPIVLQSQNNMADVVATETVNGAKQLLTDIEFSLFEGNSAVVPKSFDGLDVQIASYNSGANAIDMAGAALNSIDPIARAAEQVFGYGSFGQLTHLYLPPAVQTDLNISLDPAFRVALDNSPNSIALGTNVRAIQTTYGAIQTVNDIFIRDEKMKKPFEIRSATHAAIAVANVGFKPASYTAVAGTQSGSAFASAHAGNYYYAITGINQNGETAATVSAVVAVTAGQGVTLTITPSAGGTETGYVIYRSRKNGTNALSDLREMVKIPKAASGNTTYIDLNTEIPGSTRAYALNLNPSDQALDWKQFLPMMKIPMAAVKSPVIPWLQMICGYMRVTKRMQHVVFRGIVPSGAAWKPFG